MLNKIKKIVLGEIGFWNKTNNSIVAELYNKIGLLDNLMQIIFKHLLISTDIFISEFFGINESKTKKSLRHKNIEQFKKLYSLIISYYAYNISIKNSSISGEINTTLEKFCPDVNTIKEVFKIINKFSKTERDNLSSTSHKIIEKALLIVEESPITTGAEHFTDVSCLIICYNSALEHIQKELKTI